MPLETIYIQTETTELNVTLQLSSGHLSNSHLGASVPSIPDYVYSQLSLPASALSPESKKIQQDICAVSLRGQRKGEGGSPNSKRIRPDIPLPCSTVLASLKSVHETLSQERQKLQEAWEGNPGRRSAQVGPHGPAMPPRSPLEIHCSSFLCTPSSLSLQRIRPRGLLLWPTPPPSISTPATTSCAVAPPKCPMNRGSAMEAPPTRSRRRGTVGAPPR